jgi:hypothetical protein
MKEIKLGRSELVTQVDDTDFKWLNQWKWYVRKSRGTFYVFRWEDKECTKMIHMHRLILGTPYYLEGEHKDRNGLNNQRFNLRNCTHQQNTCNRKSRGASKYIGVSVRTRYSKKEYIVQIQINGKRTHIGLFKTEEDAARAYDEVALKYYGEFANLNFK